MAVAKKRTSKKQFIIYLKELEEHPVLINGKMGPNEGPEVLKNIWLNLSTKLNSCGDGPIRTVPEWKKVFTEWKSSTRKKCREGKTTTEQEKRLIELSGSGVVTGLSVEEIGAEAAVTGLPVEEIEAEEKVEFEEEYLADLEDVPNTEDIIIEVVNEPASTTRKKRIRKTTGDVLCDAYARAISETNNSLDKISQSVLEIAKAFHRYCDILEKQ